MALYPGLDPRTHTVFICACGTGFANHNYRAQVKQAHPKNQFKNLHEQNQSLNTRTQNPSAIVNRDGDPYPIFAINHLK